MFIIVNHGVETDEDGKLPSSLLIKIAKGRLDTGISDG